jgi:subtilisin family serine protease
VGEIKMKKKIFSILFMVCIITPGFFVLTNHTNALPTFMQTNDLIGIADEPYFEAELNDIETSSAEGSLPSIIPYWYDLVDKEEVVNNGTGVYVAVLDTGLLPDWSFIFSEANIADELGKGFSHDIYWDDEISNIAIGPLRDDRGFLTNKASGHGTHVTSTVVGYNYANIAWIEGIAPEATIIPVLVMDAWEVETPYGPMQLSGGTNEMVAAGIYYIANLADSLDGPVIINMSLGGPTQNDLITAAIDYAIEQGVIVVAAAGNEGEAQMDYPGAYSPVISAAAGGWTETLSKGWTADVPEELYEPDDLGNDFQVYLETFSGRPNKTIGQKYRDLDVMAPGAWVVGPYKAIWAPVTDWNYYYVSGTSMATPCVSAMAALVLEIFPFYEQKDVEKVLKLAAGNVMANILRGFPPKAENVKVAYFGGSYYNVSWGRHDYGKGFLTASMAVFYGFVYLSSYLHEHHHHHWHPPCHGH